jgi:hypothetical protein
MRLGILSVIVACLGLVTSARAAVIFSGSNGNLAASAEFDAVGGNLLVRLTNTSSSDVLLPAEVLSAVFFDVVGSPTLTRVSAFIAPGSGVVNGTAPGGDVGGAWAFKAALVGAPGGAKYGISSAGLGLFGPSDVFPGADPDPNNGPDGMSFGLLSAGDNTATGNSPILTNTFVKNSVDFVLSGLPAGFSLGSITNVRAQYGTALVSEPEIQLFPEPTSLSLIALGATMLIRRRRAA